MNRPEFLSGLLCMLCLSVTIAADAADYEWYFSYGVGDTEVDYSVDFFDESLSSSVGDALPMNIEGNATRIALGHNIDKSLSYEVGSMEFDKLGIIEDYALPDGSLMSAKTSVDGYYVAAISKYSASESMIVTGRLGYYLWEMKTTGSVNSTLFETSKSNNDFFYGLGMEFNWLGLEYDILKIAGEHVKYLGASFKYNF